MANIQAQTASLIRALGALKALKVVKNVFMISNEGVRDAVRDGLRGANHGNSLAIARICNDADRPKPRPHTHEEIVNTF